MASLSEAVYRHEEEFDEDYKSMSRYVLSWLCDSQMDMSFELFKELIDSGKADVYTRAPHGGTVMIVLGMGGEEKHFQAVKYLLDRYPDLVNDRSQMTTETALHMAGMFGRKEIFQELLKRGADPTLKTYKREGLVEMIQNTSYLSGKPKQEMIQLARDAINDWKTKCHLPGCGATQTAEGRPLQKCGGCRRALYCGREHQAEHWRSLHKHLCKTYKQIGQEPEIPSMAGCPTQ
eukprot:TRINITY_DN1085_c0_g1_i2.p1 TRINITY_DN1085_c0_g1~~TRINITY_DN1085_c0_g1_i2.p1  ORF type:complete len:257 (-),score=39.35 TRINITY_DN1085_c0_g1_i2:65-766(-)